MAGDFTNVWPPGFSVKFYKQLIASGLVDTLHIAERIKIHGTQHQINKRGVWLCDVNMFLELWKVIMLETKVLEVESTWTIAQFEALDDLAFALNFVAFSLKLVNSDRWMMANLFCQKSRLSANELEGFTQNWIKWLFQSVTVPSNLCQLKNSARGKSEGWLILAGLHHVFQQLDFCHHFAAPLKNIHGFV